MHDVLERWGEIGTRNRDVRNADHNGGSARTPVGTRYVSVYMENSSEPQVGHSDGSVSNVLPQWRHSR